MLAQGRSEPGLPGDRLSKNLHAGPVAGIRPCSMNHAVIPGSELRIVPKETAAREANARIKLRVADGHLRGEGVPAVGRLCHPIPHLGEEWIVAVIIKAHVNRAIPFGGSPREDVVLAVVEGVVVHAADRRRPGLRIYRSRVNAEAAFEWAVADLVRGERAIGGIHMNTASRRDCSLKPKAPVDGCSGSGNESGYGFGIHHPTAAG